MFPTKIHAYATRAVIAVVPVAMVCTYATHVVLPVARPTSAEYTETAAITDSPTTIGIADSDLYTMTPAEIDTTLDTLQSIGVQNIRIFVPWAYVEPANGTYDWTTIDSIVDAAAARNMGVLAEINSTPTWAATTSGLPGSGQPNAADFASFASTVATRYGNDISAYEIWNEPNSVEFYNPIDPASYTALLKAAYPAIKAANPNATVIAGALGSTVSIGSLTLDPVTFVQDMLADGAAGYFDDLSFHPYQETTEFSQGAGIPNSPLTQVNAIEQLLVGAGLSNDKVWITEYGLSTTDVSQQTQATYIQDLLNTWKNISYAGPVFIYTAQDTNSASTNPQDTYGIYESDWTPKLAVAVIQQAIAAANASAATNPLAALGQQISNALTQVVQTFAQNFAQNVATALAQALANLFAGFGAAATPAATSAVQTKALVATTPASSTPSTSTPNTSAPTTPKVKALNVLSSAAPTTKPAASPAATPAATLAAKTTTTPAATPTASAGTTPAATPAASNASPTTPSKTLRPKDTPRLRFSHPTTETTAVVGNSPVAPKTG
jgi:hypothetical protein